MVRDGGRLGGERRDRGRGQREARVRADEASGLHFFCPSRAARRSCARLRMRSNTGFISGGHLALRLLHLGHALAELGRIRLGLDAARSAGGPWPARARAGPPRSGSSARPRPAPSLRRKTPTVRFSLVKYSLATRWMSAAVTRSTSSRVGVDVAPVAEAVVDHELDGDRERRRQAAVGVGLGLVLDLLQLLRGERLVLELLELLVDGLLDRGRVLAVLDRGLHLDEAVVLLEVHGRRRLRWPPAGP